MKLVDKALVIPCSANDEKDFFLRWVEYLKPRHHLTTREQEVFAAFLRNRYELSKGITDKAILDEVCLNEANRDKIRQSLNMSGPQMNGVLSKLRERKIIAPSRKPNGKIDYYVISPSFIPDIDESGDFKLMFIFRYKSDAEKGDSATGS